MQVKDDYYWMAKAIQLAKKGRFTTSPNPRVGCVIVDDSNVVVGEGFHIQAGTPHAEIHSLNQAGNHAKGATAYVTLEPCSHYGRTPPCSLALINAGVARVVIGMTDPNPTVSGNGIRMLRDAGITVTQDVMKETAATLNPGFIKRMTTGKPFVRVKLGISLDGKIALENGESQWITGPHARKDVQALRAQSCVVLTGAGTLEADNPSLLVRDTQFDCEHYPLEVIRQPARVVVTSRATLKKDYQCFNDNQLTYVATNNPAFSGFENTLLVESQSEQVDLQALMTRLGEMQFNEVLVEAGPTLAGALLMAGEVDELVCYQAPVLLGDKGMSMVNLPAFDQLSQAIQLQPLSQTQVGNDVKLVYRVITETPQ